MLIKIKEAEEKTEGGILLPSTAQTKPQGGEVVAVGEGKTVGKNNVEISVKVMLLLCWKVTKPFGDLCLLFGQRIGGCL